MTINNATVEQINVALLDIDKRIKALNIDNEAIKSLQNSIKTIKSSLNETKAGLQSGATYNINISGNATTATTATTATYATTAEIVNSAASADEANYAKLAGNISAGGTSGQVLTSNGPSAAPSWQDQKTQTVKTVKFVDYRTGNLTFSSLTDQKKIELSSFGPGITEDNVLSFMVIYWGKVQTIAQADFAKSQGTGSSGLVCALHPLSTGTGFAVIRCVYLA